MRMVLAIWSSCINLRKTPLSPFKGRGRFVERSMLSVCISELLRYFSLFLSQRTFATPATLSLIEIFRSLAWPRPAYPVVDKFSFHGAPRSCPGGGIGEYACPLVYYQNRNTSFEQTIHSLERAHMR